MTMKNSNSNSVCSISQRLLSIWVLVGTITAVQSSSTSSRHGRVVVVVDETLSAPPPLSPPARRPQRLAVAGGWYDALYRSQVSVSDLWWGGKVTTTATTTTTTRRRRHPLNQHIPSSSSSSRAAAATPAACFLSMPNSNSTFTTRHRAVAVAFGLRGGGAGGRGDVVVDEQRRYDDNDDDDAILTSSLTAVATVTTTKEEVVAEDEAVQTDDGTSDVTIESTSEVENAQVESHILQEQGSQQQHVEEKPAPVEPGSSSSPLVVEEETTTMPMPMPRWKAVLTERLRRKQGRALQKLRLGPVDIYLLGTAHVSNDSAADAWELLQCVHPDCIFVELCEARIPLMEGAGVLDNITTDANDNENNTTSSNSTKNHNNKPPSLWQRLKTTQEAQGGSKFQALSAVLLSQVQEEYASTLGVELGGEFRRAYEYWQQRHAAQQAVMPNSHVTPTTMTAAAATVAAAQPSPPHLILGDRPVSLTLLRAWESLKWWPKIQVMLGLLWSAVFHKPNREELKQWMQQVLDNDGNTDILTESLQELRQQFPTLYTTIIEERDAWLAAKMVQTARALAASMGSSASSSSSTTKNPVMVAIVGAGHVPGICTWLTTPRATPEESSPEHVLKALTTTRRWAHDDVVQKELVPQWVMHVTEVMQPGFI